MAAFKFKYLIGIQTFEKIREGGYLYADKTGYVYRLAQQFQFVFLSRPHHFAEDLTDVYNPFSLLNALVDRRIKDHWFETGTPTVLVNMLQKFDTDITRLEGIQTFKEEFDIPIEQMRNLLPLLYQSGYFTIKDYDHDTDTYTLGYPNNEVYQGAARTIEEWVITAP